MSFSSNIPSLATPTAEQDQFLSFLNLGNRTTHTPGVSSPSFSSPVSRSTNYQGNMFSSFLNRDTKAGDAPENMGTAAQKTSGGILTEAECKKQRIEQRRKRKLQELRENRRQENVISPPNPVTAHAEDLPSLFAAQNLEAPKSDTHAADLPSLFAAQHSEAPKSEQDDQAPEHVSDHSQSSSSDNNPLTPCEELVVIDPEGDIVVTIGLFGKAITALCSSPCMRRASPKWKALIQASPREIHLEEDPEMVLDLIRIAHAQFSGLPTQTYFNELLEFARICHIYEITELVRPWLHLWVDPWARKARDPGYEGFIFIAWIFGYADTFEVLTHHLALQATSSKISIPDETLNMFDQTLRGTIADNIFRVRNEIIPDIIDICHTEVYRLLGDGTSRSCYADHLCEEPGMNTHSDLCDLIATASLQRGLQSLGLWPALPTRDTSHFTIQGLLAQLEDVSILSYPGHTEELYCSANANFHSNLREKRKEVAALQDSHKEHFVSFENAPPRNDPLVWKSKAVEDMGFLERDIRSNDSDSEDDESFQDPHPDYDEDDEDQDYDYDEDSDSDSEPDEEYLESGEESDYTSDVEYEAEPEAEIEAEPESATTSAASTSTNRRGDPTKDTWGGEDYPGHARVPFPYVSTPTEYSDCA